jgi:hypothetical protein
MLPSGILHSVVVLKTDIANFVPSSPILVTLLMEAMRSSETSVLTRVTRRNIPEDFILQSKINLKFHELHIIE